MTYTVERPAATQNQPTVVSEVSVKPELEITPEQVDRPTAIKSTSYSIEPAIDESEIDLTHGIFDFIFITAENGVVHIFANRTESDFWNWFEVSSCDSLEDAEDYARYWVEAAPFRSCKGSFIRVWRVAEGWLGDLIGVDENHYSTSSDSRHKTEKKLKAVADRLFAEMEAA